MIKRLLELNEYSAAGLYEEPDRSLFYRKALGLRRYYENCKLPVYNGEKLYPSGQQISPHYMNGLPIDYGKIENKNADIADKIRSEFCLFESTVPIDHTVAGNMYTHSIPNYERILKEGFLSYIPRIENIKDTDLKDGLINLVEGIKTYINRCVDYLESVSAEKQLINALKKVPLNPAENIYEAVVGWNFIMYLDCCDNLGCVASGLLPYYKGEDITDLLDNLFLNLDSNDGYSMALGTDYNPLTLQCLEASKGKRRPMIELFVDDNTPDEIWKKAFEVIRTTNGQPAFYNPQVLLNGLKHRFKSITDEDIKKFCGGGCTETMLAGLSNVGSLDAGINLLLILENLIKTELTNSESFDEFYEQYITEVSKVVDIVTHEIYNSQKNKALYNPLPMRTLLIDDCIDKGLDYNNGGARYMWSIVNFAGLINVIDSLLVIRDFVFKDETYTAEELVAALKNNDTAFLEKAREHKVCFGLDLPEVNEFSKKISNKIFSMLDNKKTYFGEGFIPASIQFLSQIAAGQGIGATPDGREKGAPLCDSLGAIFCKDMLGPTALLNSVTSLDLEKALGIPVLNFNVNFEFNDDTMKALILGYMCQGGIQMQITCATRETLEDAYKNPENYKNLIVRVGGYSEYFNNLSDELKRMVIARTIH